jgi:diacylglycerol kinase family enzyme
MLFQGTLNKSPYYSHQRCKSLTITAQSEKMYWHRDGEPDKSTAKLEVEIEQRALKVCSPFATS